MAEKHAAKRIKLLRNHVAALFIPPYPLDILYIGGKPDRIQCVPELHAAGHRITLLEFVPDYVNGLKESPFFEHIILGDMRGMGSTLKLPIDQYDVTFWWHGPEHLQMDESYRVIAVIERLTKYLVVLASPYGKTRVYKYKYPGQVHVSAWYPRTYTRMGYETQVIGRKDAGLKAVWSHVLAWKWLKSLPLPEPITG